MSSVYIGTYTEPEQGGGAGIHQFDFDEATGRLSPRAVYSGGPNPSFIALNEKRDRLYAVNELDDGVVSAFERDAATGALTFINSQSSHGGIPCFVGFDRSGRYLLVANYGGGTMAVFPIDANGGLEAASDVVDHRAGPIKPRRVTSPHPHMIAPAPDSRVIVVTDLGLDATLLYRFDRGKLTLSENGIVEAAVGAGPRHFAFSSDGKTAYVINELNSTLDAFDYEDGKLVHRQTVSTLPGGYVGESSCAQVLVVPDGRFVYGSNRGHDSLAIWLVDAATGRLSNAEFVSTGGACPRNFSISPSGKWLIVANQESGDVHVFARDASTGALTPAGEPADIAAPVCVLFCE